MGKKVCKVSKKEKKNQFQSLIKELKPKVYITDSSSFMKLVQELTGNGDPHTSSPSDVESKVSEQVGEPLMNNNIVVCDQRENQYQYQCRLQGISISSSIEAQTPLVNSGLDHQSSVNVLDSIVASADSPVSSYSNNTCSTTDEEYDFSSLQFFIDATPSMHKEIEDLLAYQEIEAFLLDNVDRSSFYNCYAQVEQEVSIYDYELTGLTSN